MQKIERCGVARRAVEGADSVLDVLQNLRRPRGQLPQPVLRHDALAVPLGDPLRRRVRVRRHLLQRRDDALELQQIRIRRAQMRGQLVEAGAIDAGCLPRIDRQLHVKVPQQQPSVPELELQLATLEHTPVLIPENRQQQLAPQLALHREPVDVEEAAGPRARPVFEDVAPPGVRGRRNPHVVRHEIHDVLEIVLPQRVGERRQRVDAADLDVHFVVIADVVPVRGSWLRREVRRRVRRANSELAQIRDDLTRRVQGESAVHLQAIRARRREARTLSDRGVHHAPPSVAHRKITAPGR